jgi:FMN phosphatase YigB (HAD superfamily)
MEISNGQSGLKLATNSNSKINLIKVTIPMHPNSPVFEFLHHLIQHARVKRIIYVGDNAAKNLVSINLNLEIVQFGPSAGSPEWLRPETDESPPVRFIETDLEQPFVIDQALLEDAIVVCLDVLDQLQNPSPLINTLAAARKHCKFMLITVADRVRTAGFTCSEPLENTRSHLKWSAEEFFQALVKAGFPQSMLFGFTSNSLSVGRKNSILVVAGLEAEPKVVPGDFRVAAIINLFNEIDIIETIVRYLADQGIEVHLVDNWSDDGSFELCQRLLEQKLIKNLLRFPVLKTINYEWAKQLDHTAEYAAQLDANWVIHYDADEIRCSPWQNLNLFKAIKFIDFLGYTAIDFTIMDFKFTDDSDEKYFSPDNFDYFEFGRHVSNFLQIKAWKNLHQLVDLVKWGGHEAVFAEQRVYPLKFLTKHFSLRSKKQANKKIFCERLPRITKERAERNWHVHLDQYKYFQSIEPWNPYELTAYDAISFPYEFLVERLSGVSVWRESSTSLNRNTAENLGRAVEEMDGRLVTLNQVVAERDGQIITLYNSTSWRATKLLRLLSRLLRGERPLVAGVLRARLLHYGKRLYWRLPVQYRTPLRHWGYRNFGPLFKGMRHNEQRKGAGAYSCALPADGNLLLLIDTLPQVEGRIAIHLHIYYHDLADEFSQYLKNMPFDYDLYVSVASEEGIKVCQKAFSGLAKQNQLVIEQVLNRGRDIAPMFCTFGLRLRDYDYIAHLHSKKSLYNKGATEGWRQYLCGNLLGSEKRIRQIFAIMQGDTPYGIVYPQNYMLLPYQANTWLANKALGAAWCARLGISPVPQGYFDFPAGSMFWAKGNALKPLFDTGITLDDFTDEAKQTDGTFAHCLERLLVLSTLKQGYKTGIIKNLQHHTWSAWGFNQYAARSFQSMIDQLAVPTIKLIAFDIFDTLLCRPLLDAESVKSIVAARIGGNTGGLYLQYRPIAESQAREAAGKDVGMAEIFSRLHKLTGLSDKTLAQLRNLEEEVEKASVWPRSGGVELYRQSLATGNPVALISDMFLPRAVIEDSLQSNGVSGWNMLFLSNEIGLRKDTGELYEHVLFHYGITNAEMLMVGDNEHSDFQIPCDKGIVSMHLLKPLEFARGLPRFRSLIETNEGSGDINRELTLGLVLQQNFSAISYPDLDPASLFHPTPFNFGYSLIGPLLVGLSQWLVESAHRDGIDRLYFLAREGKLIKLVYDLWTEGLEDLPRADYLILSRRAVSVPMMGSLEDILSVARVTYYPNTIANFLYERYGLQLSTERWNQISDQVQWSSNRTVEVCNQQIDHLLPLLNALEAEIIANGGIEYGALRHYLSTMGLDEPGRQAVVDIGYGATIQGYLNRLVATPVHGYYMITDQRSAKVSQKHDVIIRGCYVENGEPSNASTPMYLHSFELEKLLSSSDPQIVCYELDHENTLMPHGRVLSNIESSCSSLREELQDGVIRYARDARSIRERILPSYKPSCGVAKQLYEAFIGQQSQLETDLLKKIVLDDYYCGRGLVR